MLDEIKKIQAIVFTIGADTKVRIANKSIPSTVGQLYGLLKSISNIETTLGNLATGDIISNYINLKFINPIMKSGKREFKSLFDFYANHQILVDCYEVIGDDSYIRDFANYNKIFSARVRIPLAKYISGLDTDEVTIVLETPLTQFSSANIKLAQGRGGFTGSVPKVFGENQVRCQFVTEDDSYYWFKACEGPIGTISEIRIDDSLPLVLPDCDIIPEFGAFRLLKDATALYFADYNDPSEAVVTIITDGYVNLNLRNLKHAIRHEIKFGDQIRIPDSTLNASYLDNGNGTSRFTYNAIVGAKNIYWARIPGFWCSRKLKVRYKWVSGIGINFGLYFGSRLLPASSGNNFIKIPLTDIGVWQERIINLLDVSNFQNIFYTYDFDDWFTFYMDEIQITHQGNDALVVDIEYIQMLEEGQTENIVDQVKDAIISNTEEMGNLLSNSLGYGPYLIPPSDYGELTDPANENEINSNAFIGSYVAKIAGNPGNGSFNNDQIVFDHIILLSDTEFVFTLRHSLLLSNYYRTGIRAYVKIENVNVGSSKFLFNSDNSFSTWGITANLDRIFLNLVDPVHWNESQLRFKTPLLADVLSNSWYRITIGFFNLEFVCSILSSVGKSRLNLIQGNPNPPSEAIKAHSEGYVNLFIEDISFLTQIGSLQPNFKIIVDLVGDNPYSGVVSSLVDIDSYPKVSGTQNPSPTDFVNNSQIEIYTPCYVNGVSLRPFSLDIDANVALRARVLTTGKVSISDVSLESELKQIYKEIGFLVYADENNKLKAMFVNKSAFRLISYVIEEKDIQGVVYCTNDSNDIYKNNIQGNVDYSHKTNSFDSIINFHHRVELTNPIVDEINFTWVKGIASALKQIKSRILHQDMTGYIQIYDGMFSAAIANKWGMRDIDLTIGGHAITQIKVGDAVSVQYKDIDGYFIVQSVSSQRISGADKCQVKLFSLFSDNGANIIKRNNSLVHLYGELTYVDLAAVADQPLYYYA